MTAIPAALSDKADNSRVGDSPAHPNGRARQYRLASTAPTPRSPTPGPQHRAPNTALANTALANTALANTALANTALANTRLPTGRPPATGDLAQQAASHSAHLLQQRRPA